MYFLASCVSLSFLVATFVPPDVPGAGLLKLLERIDPPTPARFLSFSGCQDESNIPTVNTRQLVLRADLVCGITTPKITASLDLSRSTWRLQLREFGVTPAAALSSPTRK